jgi:hypothetical protein
MERVTLALGLRRAEEEDVLTPDGIGATNNKGVGEGGAAVTGANDDDSCVIAVQNAQTTGDTAAPAPTIQQGPLDTSGNTLPRMPMGIPAGPPPGKTSNFSGIDTALKRLGHVMYNLAMLDVELSLQRDIQGSLQGFCSKLYAAASVFGNAGESENGDNDPHRGGFLFPQVGDQRLLPREGLGFHWGPMGQSASHKRRRGNGSPTMQLAIRRSFRPVMTAQTIKAHGGSQPDK